VLASSVVLTPARSLAPAQAVERLAATARTAPALDIPPGRYLHTVTTDAQNPVGDQTAEHTARAQGSYEAWTDASGTIWRIDTRTVDGKTYRSVHRFDPPTAEVGTIPNSLTGLRSWPTSGPALDQWLRDRLTTKSSLQQDDAIFEMLKDQLNLEYTPPGVRAAAVEVIAELRGTRVLTERGRTSLQYASQWSNPGRIETLVFDDATSRVLEVRESSPLMSYTSRTATTELVDTLPAQLHDLPSE
jgi:hypothetical protein